ncbi:hypothetical protein FisN_5Hu455 [Fistulifera solaris]|uniref:Uncharacterized protein n=1 Tax=Fistulifera solaris TaxID=1519565 RepID=A0A1Z5JSR5_FISSO|nr:hypothetical protein FisN_5Hu455 [Fistulifera solaris]|eukprot:GAX17070.1 hypothetical protein FisN_5Hu455 [Fistulifera solaris]
MRYRLWQIPQHRVVGSLWRRIVPCTACKSIANDFLLEYAFPSTRYRMGYWSNVLVVAPLPSPQTKTGKTLAEANL